MNRLVGALFVLGICLAGGVSAAVAGAHHHSPGGSAAGSADSPQAAKTQRLESKGVVIEFAAARAGSGAELMEGEYADLKFRVSDAQTKKPIKGRIPGAWLDMDKQFTGTDKSAGSCKEKIETYLKGMVGSRPMLDLNSYYLLVMNQDASISVIDPLVGVSGRSNLFATIILNRPPADWVQSADGKRLFVSMPDAGQVAVVDTETFKVTGNIPAGSKPTRLGLQPDGRYLWVGNDAGDERLGGVTVVDTDTLKPVTHIPTGKGHHELAFATGDRYAFVSNREQGGISVIEIASTRKIKDIKTGSLPIALAHSPKGRVLYVADGVDGTLTAIGEDGLEVLAKVQAKPGLGPLRLTPDGRWLLAVNAKESLVHVLDVATNRIVQDIPVGSRPFEIVVSEAFAYVRSLDSEHVGMISLAQLGKASALQLSTFSAGAKPPKDVADLGIGSGMVPAVGEAAMLVVSPADNLVYYYMEGMLAPSGNFRNPAHQARGIHVINRSLKETQPGEYTARVKIPAAGRYDVAFLLESPRVIHCFRADAVANPLMKLPPKPVEVTYLNESRAAPVGQPLRLRFRLDDPKDGSPKPGLADVKVLYYASPGLERTEVLAQDQGGGVYQANLDLRRTGAYYVNVAVPSLNMPFGSLGPFSLIAIEPAKAR